MRPVSLVLITLNAGKHLEKCLASCDFASEIVLVDSGSTDETLAIAARHGARVLHQDWLGFGRQRRVSVNAAAHDWVLCLDADEWLSPRLAASIKATLEAPRHTAYLMSRASRFMGRYLTHGEGYPDRCLRLFDRRHAEWTEDEIHEHVVSQEPPGLLDGDLMHDTPNTLAEFLHLKPNQYSTLQAEEMYRRGKTVGLAGLIMKPWFRFLKFYVLKKGFRDGLPGFIHIVTGCFNTFVKYAKLLELQRSARHAGDSR